MIELHYDEEALVTMLESGALSGDAHLDACGECAEKAETFRLVAGALRDPATWDKRELDEEPDVRTIRTLRAFAETTASDDAAAGRHLSTLLAGPREQWPATLAAHPEYRTAGTVRRLNAAVDHALNTMPADAVAITALAVDIAEHLDPALVGSDVLARLRGSAWRERAYALYYTGQMAAAASAVATAASHLENCALAEYELGRLSVVEALVDRSLDRFPESRQAARRATRAFAEFGDERRTAAAGLAEAHSCFGAGAFHDALEILTRVERQLRGSDDAETHARALGNLGYCCWKLNRVEEALSHHEAAAAILDGLGIHTESVRIRWNIAAILAQAGRVDEALDRFEAIHLEFRRLGMASVATLVQLDAAELLLALGRYAEVEEICRGAMVEFAAAGFAHTERALTALALIKEAAANRTATPIMARQVRDYLRRLPEEPSLLFLLPPRD